MVSLLTTGVTFKYFILTVYSNGINFCRLFIFHELMKLLLSMFGSYFVITVYLLMHLCLGNQALSSLTVVIVTVLSGVIPTYYLVLTKILVLFFVSCG